MSINDKANRTLRMAEELHKQAKSFKEKKDDKFKFIKFDDKDFKKGEFEKLFDFEKETNGKWCMCLRSTRGIIVFAGNVDKIINTGNFTGPVVLSGYNVDGQFKPECMVKCIEGYAVVDKKSDFYKNLKTKDDYPDKDIFMPKEFLREMADNYYIDPKCVKIGC